MTKAKADEAKVDEAKVDEAKGDVEASPYGDKPIFTYKPKDGSDPIVFPAHSTIRGRVNGVTYLQFLRRIDKEKLSSADQMFVYLDRSGCTEEMEDRLLGLDDEDEVLDFFRAWINHDDQPQQGLPPES